MIRNLASACDRPKSPPTRRETLTGAGVMIAGTLFLTILGVVARRVGWTVTGEVLLGISFPASLTLSMPFWLMKGTPRSVAVAIVSLTLVFLFAIGYLASMI